MQTGLNFSTYLKFSFIVSCLFKQNPLNNLSNISFSSSSYTHEVSLVFQQAILIHVSKLLNLIFSKKCVFFLSKFELNLGQINNSTLKYHYGGRVRIQTLLIHMYTCTTFHLGNLQTMQIHHNRQIVNPLKSPRLYLNIFHFLPFNHRNW